MQITHISHTHIYANFSVAVPALRCPTSFGKVNQNFMCAVPQQISNRKWPLPALYTPSLHNISRTFVCLLLKQKLNSKTNFYTNTKESDRIRLPVWANGPHIRSHIYSKVYYHIWAHAYSREMSVTALYKAETPSTEPKRINSRRTLKVCDNYIYEYEYESGLYGIPVGLLYVQYL